MTNVYISFGQAHVHKTLRRQGGHVTLDKDSIAVIECVDYEAGRAKAFELFDGVFHNCWSEKEWDRNDYLVYFPRGLIEV